MNEWRYENIYITEGLSAPGYASDYAVAFVSSEGPYVRGIVRTQPDKTADPPKTTECLPDHGKDYKGTLSVTMKGHTCLPWKSPKAIKRAAQMEFLPEVVLEQNYCRNPDNDTEGPWCFVDHPNVTMEYCDLELCGE